MDTHVPAAEMDNAIRFSTYSRMSGFQCHSSKWVCSFPSIYVRAWSFSIYRLQICDYYASTALFLQPLIKVSAIFRWKIDFKISFSSVFSKIDTSPQQRSILDLRPTAKFSGKIRKFLRPRAEYLAALVLLCCHYKDTYITCLTVSFNTV